MDRTIAIDYTEFYLPIALEALRKIANYDHVEGCRFRAAPVTECVCNELSQRAIAQQALDEIEKLGED